MLLLGLVALAFPPVQAAYLILVDVDGADDGPRTPGPGFSFGGDTTTASSSSASMAFGLPAHDSIFGGDGTNLLDTYLFTYNPSLSPDNFVLPAGQDLGEGALASGLLGGGAGAYAVYATWPFTSTVSGGLTSFSVATAGDGFSVDVNQNDVDPQGVAGRGDVWVKLGEVNYTGGDIVVTQLAGSNTFVSMRSSGIMFEAVPEPGSLTLLGLGGLLALRRRRG